MLRIVHRRYFRPWYRSGTAGHTEAKTTLSGTRAVPEPVLPLGIFDAQAVLPLRYRSGTASILKRKLSGAEPERYRPRYLRRLFLKRYYRLSKRYYRFRLWSFAFSFELADAFSICLDYKRTANTQHTLDHPSVLLTNTQNIGIYKYVLSISPFLVLDDNTRICNKNSSSVVISCKTEACHRVVVHHFTRLTCSIDSL